MGFDCLGEVIESRSTLLATGFNHGEHCLYEAAARRALRAKRQLAPDNGMTQRPFARVVRRFHSVVIEKHPEPVAMFVQLTAHANQRLVAAM